MCMCMCMPSSTEYLVEAGVAVGLVLLLLERALVQLLETEGADEMFRMEFLKHGRNATARYGLRAAGAERAALGVIMCLTVRQALVVKERATLERLPTVLQDRKKENTINKCKIFIYISFHNFRPNGTIRLSVTAPSA